MARYLRIEGQMRLCLVLLFDDSLREPSANGIDLAGQMTHSWLAGHARPQRPQLARLVERVAHSPAQRVRRAPQVQRSVLAQG